MPTTAPPAARAFCIRCRGMRDIDGALIVRRADGRPAQTGTCATCGARTYRLLAWEDCAARGQDRPARTRPGG